MSKKDLSSYNEELPPEQGKYHLVYKGNLVLINFAVNSSALLTEHKRLIDEKVVPFVIRAVTKLGPGSYTLHVVGSASATGNRDHNFALSGQRAYAAAMYAIKGFEAQQKKRPELARITLDPQATANGNDTAVEHAKRFKLKTPGKIEKAQPMFRGAAFQFRAALEHPGSAAIFQIREIYLFKFKPKEESLPEALKWLKKELEDPRVKAILEKLGVLVKPLKDAIEGLLGAGASIGKEMIRFMIPNDVDYCFEVKDYRETHALYRFSGVVHAGSMSVLDALSFLSKFNAILKAVVALAKKVKQAEALVRQVEKMTEGIQQWVIDQVRKVAGAEVAAGFEKALKYIKEGTLIDHITAPGSDWTPFEFHDRGPDHNVVALEGPAKRYGLEIGMAASVDVSFGGFVPNSWTAYNASAHIVSSFSLRNSLFSASPAEGQFHRIRGPYGSDLAVGPSAKVTE